MSNITIETDKPATPATEGQQKIFHLKTTAALCRCFGIKVLVARNYCQNLGEETVKGMTEKARAGIYPSCAPLGYRNADGPGGKRVIVSEPGSAPLFTEVFERFATGRYLLKVLVKEVNAEGLKLRGRKIYSSVVHQILRKRLYTGDFDWDGSTYTGSHEPLVTRECWQRVQELLDARAENKTRKVKHDFPYTGLVHCGHCGCLFVGELKKRKYVYYHCTGNRGKCEAIHAPGDSRTRGRRSSAGTGHSAGHPRMAR